MPERHEFKHIYGIPPIDFWEGSVYPSEAEHYDVLEQMPEAPRSDTVHKLYVPIPGYPELIPIFLCKADNNGTVYIFSDYELFDDISICDLWKVK